MGQYHWTVNLDKKEFISPHKIGLGLKMAEQVGDFHATTGDILFLLLACSHSRGGGDVPAEGIEDMLGRWAGDRVIVIGDYSEPSDVPGIDASQIIQSIFDNEDGLPQPEWTDISELLRPLILKLWGVDMEGGGWMQRKTVAYYPEAYLGEFNKEID